MRARRAFTKMVKARAHKRKNPRTAHGKRVVKHRPVFYGSSKKLGVRSIHKRLNPRKGTVMAYRRRRRKFRRNPSFAGLRSHASGLGGQFKNAAIGALGIVVNNQIKPMITGMIGGSLGTFTPLVTAFVPLLIGNFVKSPMVKIAAQTAAAVELSGLIGGLAGGLLPTGVSPVSFIQPPGPGSNTGMAGIGDGGSFSTVPFPLAE